MPSLEERVAYLEGKVEEQTKGFGDLTVRISGLSTRIDALDQKVDRFRAELSSRIDALDQKVDRFREELSSRINALDQRLSSRIDGLDQKVDAGFHTADAKMSRQFLWLVGLQMATVLAVIGGMLQD